MSTHVEKYKGWFTKTTKELTCSKRPESLELMRRFQSLQLREDPLGVQKHCEILQSVLVEFSQERKNLRWLEKMIKECEQWKGIIKAVIFASKLDEQVVMNALVKDEIDVDQAVDLI